MGISGTGVVEEPAWWQDAARLARLIDDAPLPTHQEWYRLGDGYLEVRSTDQDFRERLELLFRECAVPPPEDDGLPRVRCTVRAAAGADVAMVTFDDPEPLDLVRFSLATLPGSGLRRGGVTRPGWRLLTLPTPGGRSALAVSGDRLLVHRATPWQALVGSLAMSRLFRLQRNLLFLHAGSVGIGGSGVLLIGPKGAGKTTLSLALAARGHAFLGDEIAGVRLGSMELVPVRRSLAVRDGPRAAAVGDALDREDGALRALPRRHQPAPCLRRDSSSRNRRKRFRSGGWCSCAARARRPAGVGACRPGAAWGCSPRSVRRPGVRPRSS